MEKLSPKLQQWRKSKMVGEDEEDDIQLKEKYWTRHVYDCKFKEIFKIWMS